MYNSLYTILLDMYPNFYDTKEEDWSEFYKRTDMDMHFHNDIDVEMNLYNKIDVGMHLELWVLNKVSFVVWNTYTDFV